VAGSALGGLAELGALPLGAGSESGSTYGSGLIPGSTAGPVQFDAMAIVLPLYGVLPGYPG
jgi:hypothetical protein